MRPPLRGDDDESAPAQASPVVFVVLGVLALIGLGLIIVGFVI